MILDETLHSGLSKQAIQITFFLCYRLSENSYNIPTVSMVVFFFHLDLADKL